MKQPSRQHTAIQSAIENAGRPLTLGEIHAETRLAVPGVGIATIYRSLKKLLAERRIEAVALPGERRRYRTARAAGGRSCYFHCTACHTILDMGVCWWNLDHLAPPGFATSCYELTLYGTCAACAMTRRPHEPAAAAPGRKGEPPAPDAR